MGKLSRLWFNVRSSIWLIPTSCALLAFGLAIATVWADRHFQTGDTLAAQWFLFDVGAAGARGVLGVIAGSIITVTGVVFSITVVALQLASSQFTPRVLRSFIATELSDIAVKALSPGINDPTTAAMAIDRLGESLVPR